MQNCLLLPSPQTFFRTSICRKNTTCRIRGVLRMQLDWLSDPPALFQGPLSRHGCLSWWPFYRQPYTAQPSAQRHASSPGKSEFVGTDASGCTAVITLRCETLPSACLLLTQLPAHCTYRAWISPFLGGQPQMQTRGFTKPSTNSIRPSLSARRFLSAVDQKYSV